MTSMPAAARPTPARARSGGRHPHRGTAEAHAGASRPVRSSRLPCARSHSAHKPWSEGPMWATPRTASARAVDAELAPALEQAAAEHAAACARVASARRRAAPARDRAMAPVSLRRRPLTDQSIGTGNTLRAAAVQLNATADTARNLQRADRLIREAAARGASSSCCPRSGPCSARGAAARRRRAARGSHARLGADYRLASWDRPRGRLAVERTDDGATTTPACTSGPTASCGRSIGSCTCSTSRSPAPSTASPSSRTRATSSSCRAPPAAWSWA